MGPEWLRGYGVPALCAAYGRGAAIETADLTEAPLQLSGRGGGPVISVKALPAGEESLDLRIYHTGGSLVQRHRLTEG